MEFVYLVCYVCWMLCYTCLICVFLFNVMLNPIVCFDVLSTLSYCFVLIKHVLMLVPALKACSCGY